MAEITKINGLPILNVTTAVGPDWGNESDVMLVKIFLDVILTDSDWGSGTGYTPSPIVGTFDTTTKNNIKSFQTKFNEIAVQKNSSVRLTADGRVSRARAYEWAANRPWAIITMNFFVHQIVKNKKMFKSPADYIYWNYTDFARLLNLTPNFDEFTDPWKDPFTT